MSFLDDVLDFLGLSKKAANVPAIDEPTDLWVPLSLMVENRVAKAGGVIQLVGSPPTRDLAKLRAHTNMKQTIGGTLYDIDLIGALQTQGLLRPDPADNTQFQVLLKLRVVYPSTAATPNVINAKSALPIVLLNHGHHDSWVSAPTGHSTAPTTLEPDFMTVHASYQGYAYLQQALAANNIISVSVDHNFACFTQSLIETRADTIIAALNALSTLATTDPLSRYHNMLDFTKIGLMGHSRGGDGVVRAVRKIAADAALSGKFSIKTVCSLAPTDFSGRDPAAKLVLGAHDLAFYLVVYGALDGDVKGIDGAFGPVGTGFRHYDRAQCPKSMVFLDTCCHDRFNELWNAEPAEDGLGDPRLVDFATHKSIAIDYLGDLFQWQLGGATLPQRFDGRSPNRAGVHASLQWMFGTALKPLEDFEDPANNLLGAARVVKNPGVPTAVVDMASVAVATSGVGGGPAVPIPLSVHTGHQTNVLHVDLSQAVAATTAVLEEPVPAAHKDWSGFDTLIFSLAGWFDPRSGATINAAKLPRLKVTLRDSAAKTASVDSTVYGAALPSRPIFKDLPPNLTLMRLETIPVALSSFTGIDLTNVAALDLDIQADNGTHVFVDNIHVVKR